jgi:CRP-like cAMP-binding protein
VRAVEDTRLTALDGGCLRQKAESDPRMGYLLMKKFAQVLTERLQGTRIRILDIYGNASPVAQAFGRSS